MLSAPRISFRFSWLNCPTWVGSKKPLSTQWALSGFEQPAMIPIAASAKRGGITGWRALRDSKNPATRLRGKVRDTARLPVSSSRLKSPDPIANATHFDRLYRTGLAADNNVSRSQNTFEG